MPCASVSEAHGIYRYTIVVFEEHYTVKKVCRQIERQIEVFQAYYHKSDEVIHQEIALYKLPIKAITNNADIESIMRRHHARILTVEENFLIIEKTGHKEETQALLDELEPLGVIEFVRSGRVAIIKDMWQFSENLHIMEKKQEETLID